MAALPAAAALLPSIDPVVNYSPKLPLRVMTADGVEIAQFGTERRQYLPLAQTPKLLQDAVLAVEDCALSRAFGRRPQGHRTRAVCDAHRRRTPGCLDDHAATGAHDAADARAHGRAQGQGDRARAARRTCAAQGPHPRDLPQRDLPRPACLWLCRGGAGLLRQAAGPALDCRDGDARRPAAEPELRQPGVRLRTRAGAAAPGARAHARHRRHRHAAARGGAHRER